MWVARLITGISGRLLLAMGLMGFGKMNPRHGPGIQKHLSQIPVNLQRTHR
ncbi:MAG TPA: hypothetical protein VII28_09320 [Puia sp.]